MSKGQSFAGEALCHQDSSAPFRWVFGWGVESQHFFAQRRRPAVLLGRNRQLCEPWQTMLSLSWIHVKTWLRVEKRSFSKDGSSEQSYASFSASGCKGAAFFGLEMHWTSVRNRLEFCLKFHRIWSSWRFDYHVSTQGISRLSCILCFPCLSVCSADCTIWVTWQKLSI